jgi:hypothetical protein
MKCKLLIAICYIAGCGIHLSAQNKETTYTARTRDLKSNFIPDSVFEMRNLKILSITGMDCDYGSDSCWSIRDLPARIGQLVNLEELILQVDEIPRLPEEVGRLQKLKRLILSDNGPTLDLTNITRISNLEYLNLDGCELERLPDRIGDLKHLRELEAVGNNFSPAERARIKKALPGCKVRF